MVRDKLKVVHIATFVNGGAGTAAYRIHEALLESNINSTFLSLDIPRNKSAKACIQFKNSKSYSPPKMISKFISVVVNRLNIKLSERLYYQKMVREISSSLNYEWISLPFSTNDVLSHSSVKDADVIHLHWVDGILDYPTFFKNNIKPTVWTLHDMNPFQGIFHYKEDEVRNKKISEKLSNEIFKIKRKLIKIRKCSLSIVSPSSWLLKAASESSMFSGIPATCIRYPIDTSLFRPSQTKDLREQLKIPKKNTIFLFVTQTVENHRKGFSLLLEALKELKGAHITLLVVGHSNNLEIPGLQILNLGSIFNNKLLCDYYSLADAFVIPSLEDNLPNVLIEAMACGTPVLAFDLGGMSEVIIDGLNGLKAHGTNAQSLKNMLEEFIIKKSEFNANQIRRFALSNFSAHLIASKYIGVYNNIYYLQDHL